MYESKKVLWKEGLFLQPQHLQQSERFMLNQVHQRFLSYHNYYYGLTEYELNIRTDAQGVISIDKLKGILPDGTPFSIPEDDTLPQSRSFLDHFSLNQESLLVFLALPNVLLNQQNVCEEGAPPTRVRYKSKTILLPDDVYGRQNKEIETGEHCFFLLFEDESHERNTVLPIARLVRNSNGTIVLDHTYIPPVLRIQASSYLLDTMRLLVEMLYSKSKALCQRRKQAKGMFAEFSSADQALYHLLQIITTYAPLLRHQFVNQSGHPYEIFTLLTECAGALCALSPEMTIDSLPEYEHTNFARTLLSLDMVIRSVIGIDLNAVCTPVPIDMIGSSTYVCKVPDSTFFDSGSFYLGLQAAAPEKELIVSTLSRIKISSRKKLDLIIPMAISGLPLTYESKPPENLAVKSGYSYFKLAQAGDFWEDIRESGTIAFYFPHTFKNLVMEMLFLRS